MPSSSTKGRARKDFKPIYIRTDHALYDVVKRHAYERGVGLGVFCEDIIRMVILSITDPDDPLLAPVKMTLRKITPVPERHDGYRLSLYGPGNLPEELPADSHMSASPHDKAIF